MIMLTLFKILKIKKTEKKLKHDLIVLRYELLHLKAYPHGFGIIEDNVLPIKHQDKIYQEKMKQLQLKLNEVKILIVNKENIMKSRTYRIIKYLNFHKIECLFIISLVILLGLFKYLS